MRRNNAVLLLKRVLHELLRRTALSIRLPLLPVGFKRALLAIRVFGEALDHGVQSAGAQLFDVVLPFGRARSTTPSPNPCARRLLRVDPGARTLTVRASDCFHFFQN